MKDYLYELYIGASPITLEEIAKAIYDDDNLSGCPSKDTIYRGISSPELPSNQHDITSIAGALAVAAGLDSESAISRSRELWTAAVLGHKSLGAGARATYLQAVTRRYQVLDLESLTPDVLDDNSRVELRSVFIAQNVRADQPPVELPKELMRQLLESGDFKYSSIPDDIDIDLMVKARNLRRSQADTPVLDILSDQDNRLTVILGDPGAGKSSLLRYLALSLASPEDSSEFANWGDCLPVIIELREYASPRWRSGRWADGTFLDFIDYQHMHEGCGLPAAILDAHMQQKHSVVAMFDGLDEIFDQEERELVSRRIAAFASRYPTVKVIVTSRIVGYRNTILESGGFRHFTLQDLNAAQVKLFVNQWYVVAFNGEIAEGSRRALRLLSAINRSYSVRELSGNPLLLTILSTIGRRRDLPRERHRVYGHAVDVLVQHWDVNKAISDSRVDMDYIDEEDKRELLRRLASFMQGRRFAVEGNLIHRDDVLAIFRSYLNERYQLRPETTKKLSQAILGQFHTRNFILSRFGPGIYGFVHRAFLEYCCADDITFKLKETQELNIEDLISDYFGARAADPRWREILLLVAAMIQPRFVGRVIDHLIDLSHSTTGSFESDPYTLLALECLGEVRSTSALDESSNRIAREAIRLIGNSPTKERDLATIESLIPVLRDLRDRFSAGSLLLSWYRDNLDTTLRSLAWAGTRYVLAATRVVVATNPDSEELRQMLIVRSSHPNYSIREATVGALTENWEDPEVREVVEAIVFTDPNANVRYVGIQVLGSIWPDSASREVIRNRTTSDPDWIVRLSSAQMLIKNWPNPEVGDFLARCMIQFPEPHMRIAIARLLLRQQPNLSTKRSLFLLVKTERQQFVREEAAVALGDGWQDSDVRDLLFNLAETDPSPYVRRAALRSLAGHWDDEDSRKLLADRQSSDPSIFVRKAAAIMHSGSE